LKSGQFKGASEEAKHKNEVAAASADLCGNVSSRTNVNFVDASWLIDSSASRHMAGSNKMFLKYTPESKGESVKLADGSTQYIKGSGTVRCGKNMSLSLVLHVPAFPINLLSISCVTNELNCIAIFFPSWCLFQELGTGKRLGTESLREGLYYLDKDTSPVVAAALSRTPLDELLLLHRRLGHIPFATLGQAYPSLYDKVCKDNLVCDACEYGKHIRSSYVISDNRSTIPLQTIHCDVWGPSGVRAIYGYRYFVTFIDCCTRTTWLYVLKTKDEVFECFRDFHKMITTQYGARVKIFRTDNGTEYVNGRFDGYLSDYGIIH
jgi:hypothetical protein